MGKDLEKSKFFWASYIKFELLSGHLRVMKLERKLNMHKSELAGCIKR